MAAAAPKPGWEANTSVSGRMYYDLTNINEEINHTPQTANGTSFDIKRFYIGVDHTFNKTFSANVTTDFTYDSTTKATQLYLKKAYLQAKLSDAFVVRIGSADLPWVPFVEDIYGYRYVENVLIDRTKFGTSADWGVHALGKIPLGMATLNYAGSVVNGAGYKVPGFIGGVYRSTTMDVEGRVNLNYKGFVAAIGGYDGKLGKAIQGTPTLHTAERFDALMAYTDKRFRVGVEYVWADYWNDVTQSNPNLTNTSDGYSLFGSVNVTPQIAVFGRYDWVQPQQHTLSSQVNNYYNFGISYSPTKIVDFALVYKHDGINDGAFTTQNFATTTANTLGATYDEIGLWGQVRW